jgi:hypothetical protein
MPSNINPTNINITYPIAGQDNDTQGFRDNFSNIKNNFLVAQKEITALQANVSISPQFVTTPITSSSAGTAGQLAYDTTHLYLCIATNSWVRASFATW